MTEEQQVLREVEASIASLPIDAQHRIKAMASNINEFVTTHAAEGHMALALVGARMAAGSV